MLRLRVGRDKIKEIELFNLSYHPDLILYEMELPEYTKLWQRIKNHPQDRIYADGITVKPLSWFGSLVQKVKGWIGLENHCEPHKVEMTLAKIAYYGYLRGFNTTAISYPESLISSPFLNLIKTKRTNENSAALQGLLLSYYRRNAAYFPQAYPRVTEEYTFGRALIKLNLHAHIPSLDPQNAGIIRETINSLTAEDTVERLPQSTFAEAYANYLVFNRYFESALKWSPDIYKQYKRAYIEFYLAKGASDATARTNAVKIITELAASADEKERNEAFNFLRVRLSPSEQLHYLEPYPELRAQLIQAYREDFIEYYLSQAPEDTSSRVKAIELIIELANSLDPTRQQKALKYLRTNFSYQEQLHYLQPYPEIKKALAQHYFESAQKIKSQYLITKLIGTLLTSTEAPLTLLAQALALNPKLLEGNHSSEFLPLKEEWKQHLFNEAIANKRFSEADTLFEENPAIQFNQNKLALLRSYYLQQLTLKSQAIKASLDRKDGNEAKNLALEAIKLAKKVARITPNDHPVVKTIIEYVNTTITIDEMKHPNVADANIAVLKKMYSLLNEHSTTNPSAELTKARNRVLLRKIDYFIEHVKGPTGFAHQWKERKAFADAHMSELTELQNLLQAYIRLNEKDKAKEIRSKVAKMHYILGDLLIFFLDNKNDAIKHFSEAAKIMDKNPYYELRHLELTGDEKRHKVRETIADISPSNEQNYNFWMEERWDAGEKIISRGFDIHDVEVTKKSFFSMLGL